MRKEVKIGLTGVAALMILFFGIKFLKGANLFSSSSTYYIRFSNAKGLSKNSTVFADGYNVGTVSDLTRDVPAMTRTFTQAGENVAALTDNLNKLNLQSTMDSVNCTIGNVNRMVAQMQSEEGTLGLLMKDPSLYNSLNHTVQSADSLVNDLKAHPKRYVHFSVFGKKEK